MGQRLSTEQARMMAERSAKARREKAKRVKTAREFAIAALNAEVKDRETGQTYVVKDAMIRKLISRAVTEADLASIRYLLELIGEAPADGPQPGDIPTDVGEGIDIAAWIRKEAEDRNSREDD